MQENRVRAEKEITMSLMSLTAVELGKKIKAKEVTVVEAVQEALDAVEKKEKFPDLRPKRRFCSGHRR